MSDSATLSRLVATPEGGERIRRARYNKGITQARLALDCGSKQQTVGRWESGRRLPSPARAKKIAEVLGWPDFVSGYLGTAELRARMDGE